MVKTTWANIRTWMTALLVLILAPPIITLDVMEGARRYRVELSDYLWSALASLIAASIVEFIGFVIGSSGMVVSAWRNRVIPVPPHPVWYLKAHIRSMRWDPFWLWVKGYTLVMCFSYSVVSLGSLITWELDAYFHG